MQFLSNTCKLEDHNSYPANIEKKAMPLQIDCVKHKAEIFFLNFHALGPKG